MSHQSDSHEVAHPTSSDHEASKVEHSVQIERGDEATQGSLPFLRESEDDEDASRNTEPLSLVSWEWMYDVDYGQLTANASHSLWSEFRLTQPAYYRRMFHAI
jgi:hypothetical protein